MLFSLVLLSKCGEILRCGGFFCFVFRVGVCRATGMCVSVFGVGFVCCFCWGFLSLNSSMSWFCVPVTLYFRLGHVIGQDLLTKKLILSLLSLSCYFLVISESCEEVVA